MKIKDRLNENRIHISFEVFPPKTEAGFDKVMEATEKIAKLTPAYISVTYGAGGSGRSRSVGSFCPLDHDGLLAVYRAANH